VVKEIVPWGVRKRGFTTQGGKPHNIDISGTPRLKMFTLDWIKKVGLEKRDPVQAKWSVTSPVIDLCKKATEQKENIGRVKLGKDKRVKKRPARLETKESIEED